MIQMNVTIPFQEGLHARPAAQLVKTCQGIKSKLAMTKGGSTIDPKSILGIMSLGAAHGDEITVTIEGEDEEAGKQLLEQFFSAV